MGLGVVDETVARRAAVPIGGAAFRREERAVLLSEKQQSAHEARETFARRCQVAGIQFQGEVRGGVPHDLVAEEAQRHDVVIVDNQAPEDYGAGESPAEVLERLIRICPRPVVTVPQAYQPGNTILVAFDGSPLAARAVFGLLGSGLGALWGVRLLTVDPQSEQSARIRAQRGIDYLRQHQVETTFQAIVSDRPPAEVICEEAYRQRCDSIVMGSHGRSALAKFLFGSVTKEVIAKSTVPLFLYH
jgi:nucleotide-binding universal stress UspA family protein